LASRAIPIPVVRTSEDVVLARVGRELYEKFFRNYTRKQWGLDPSELDASVTARVPVRTDRDDRYFTDRFQAMPRHGYTRMFQRMLAHPNIKVLLKTDHRELEGVVRYRHLIYTGPIDEYFGHRFGRLPYRSLEFKHQTIPCEVAQQAPVVNYPNDHAYTRVTEFKYLTGQRHDKTAVVYEYPRAEGDPYYPIPRPENAALYKKYRELADDTPNVHFVGRLGTYRYYNMDQVVAQALTMFRELMGLREQRGAAKTNGHIPVAPGAVGRTGVHLQPSGATLLRST
ncbi:MAG TPA: UDP-galactopyranose mutase, partial [Candidatus Limnocylindria bacterium]|nr:UDP-galactopyranose mutase [Candidatus Limnocylindria bacterium]